MAALTLNFHSKVMIKFYSKEGLRDSLNLALLRRCIKFFKLS
jgi:hypothetical protein